MFVMVYKGVTITIHNGKFNWLNKIYHAGKAKTGSRGRQPFILTTIKQEGV